MNKCKECVRYNTCGTREVFGSISCNDGFILKKQTNADKIRSMTDDELAEFLSDNTNCDCCNIQCSDKSKYPSMSSCLFRFKDWLKREVEE